MDYCYRHPDRETGVSCSNCERPICTECMTTTSVGMRCPECAGESIQVRSGAAAFGGDPTLSYALIALNVIVAVAALLSGANATGGGIGSSELLRDGAVSRPAVADGEIWRILTAGFLHYGIFHLFVNMFSLWILGGMLEPSIGKLRFAIIYFVSLLAGSFGALLLEPDGLTVGASGAIFGLMGGAVVVMRNRGIDPMQSGLGIWIGLNLLITFTVPGISIGGHVGGLVGGALAAWILFELPDRARLPRAAVAAIASALGVLAVVASVVVAGSG